MHISADRISGAFFLLLGLALYFVVIPAQVETPEGGNLAPQTVPNFISFVLIICSACLIVRPTDHETRGARSLVLGGAYAGVLALCIFVMSRFGFEMVAPFMSLAIMLMIGERRPLWLLGGAILMPLLIWFLVTYPLGRALP